MKLLDDTHARDVALVVIDALDEAGYTFEAAIPGLAVAINMMAQVQAADDLEGRTQILDEAVDIILNGGEDDTPLDLDDPFGLESEDI